MPEPIDQPLPGFRRSAGRTEPRRAAAVLVRDVPGRARSDHPGAGVVAMQTGFAPEQESMAPSAQESGGRASRDDERTTLGVPRRPGAVGGVTVRAPMLDPTRSALAADGASAPLRMHARSRRLPVARATQQPAHPRLLDRQQAIRRAERMARARPFMLPGGIVAAGVTGAMIVLFSPLFAVRSVVLRFDGTPAEQAEIARIVSPMRNQNIVRLDVSGRESVLRSLPWVSFATVSRSLPRTVVVEIASHDVAGAVRLPDGRVAMAATDGSVLSVVASNDPSVAGLAQFDFGLTATPDIADALAEPAPAILSSAKALDRRLPGRLLRVVIRNGQVEWTLRSTGVSPPVRVLIGRPRDSDIPAAALASVLSRPGPVPTVIDLRTPATPVLTYPAKR